MGLPTEEIKTEDIALKESVSTPTSPREDAPLLSNDAVAEAVDDTVPNDKVEPVSSDPITIRSMVTGCCIGIVVAAMNTGWTQGGSIIACVLSVAIFRIFRPKVPFSMQETILATTASSAAGTMTSAAGLVGPIPALKLMSFDKGTGELMLWALVVGFIGVYFAVPLRKQMVVLQKLRFPTGTATAETITALYSSGQQAVNKARALIITAGAAGAFVLLAYFVPNMERPPIIAGLGGTAVVYWGWNIYLNPMLAGGGMLSGMHVCYSMLLGSIIGWVAVGVPIYQAGWAPGPIMSYVNGVRGWILWPGVAMMTTDALTQLALSWRSVLNAFKSLFASTPGSKSVSCKDRMLSYLCCRCCKVRKPKLGECCIVCGTDENYIDYSEKGNATLDADDPVPDSEQIPWWSWVGGLVISSISIMIIGYAFFGLAPYLVLLAVPLSAILSMIAVRCVGETDINPIGGMGKVTQLVFAGVAPGQLVTNLMTAAIAGAGASQCGDMMHDLKMGYILKSSPRKIFISQHIGIAVGICVCVPIYKLFDAAYVIGGTELPAPAAQAWRAVAEVLANGFGSLPTNAIWGMLVGGVAGVLIPILRRLHPKLALILPSSLACGIAFIIPPEQAVAMFIGAFIMFLWTKIRPLSQEQLGFSVASGLLAGEGLMAIVAAVMKIFGVPQLLPCWGC